MAIILPVKGKTPSFGKDGWIAPNATITGDVTVGDGCTIWFSAVIRGDVCRIEIGDNSNVQDGVIIHGTYNKSNTVIGSEVSIGHGAVIHGCKIHNKVLVGMKAVIMDHAVVESNVIVAAGAVVLENSRLESGFIYAGVPAKKVKALDADASQWHITRTAEAYKMYASWYE